MMPLTPRRASLSHARLEEFCDRAALATDFDQPLSELGAYLNELEDILHALMGGDVA